MDLEAALRAVLEGKTVKTQYGAFYRFKGNFQTWNEKESRWYDIGTLGGRTTTFTETEPPKKKLDFFSAVQALRDGQTLQINGLQQYRYRDGTFEYLSETGTWTRMSSFTANTQYEYEVAG